MSKRTFNFRRQVNELLKGLGLSNLHAPLHKYYHHYFETLAEDSGIITGHAAFSEDREKTIELETVYVPLKLRRPGQEQGASGEKEEEIEPGIALYQFRHLVILGGIGAGKTTLLKYLALKFCREYLQKKQPGNAAGLIPIPLILREFPGKNRTLRKAIDDVFESYEAPKAKKIVEKDLKVGKCLLLLDGFDELITRKDQEEVTREIFSFIEAYPLCRVVITTRSSGYYGEFLGFTRLELVEFDLAGIVRYIENRFGDTNPGKSEELLRILKENPDLEDLVKTPLMLSIAVSLYDEDNECRFTRAHVYERVVRVMLSDWDSYKKITPRFSPDKKAFILRKLAFRNHCLDRRTISDKEIMEEIAGYSSWLGLDKDEYRLFLHEIRLRTSLLKQLFIDTYDFFHLSFQEYFTALELKEQEDGIAVVIPRLTETWWEEPILFLSGVSVNADPLVKRIQRLPEDLFFNNLMLTGKCIANAAFIDPLLKEEIVQELWSLYHSGEYPSLKEKAMEVLARIKPRRIIDLLVNQLTDKEIWVRRAAVDALGLIGSTEVLPALLMVLFKDKESKIRSEVALALGKIGSTDAVRPLLELLQREKDSEVRAAAAEALGLSGGRETVPALLAVLSGDKDNKVRQGAAAALGNIHSDSAVPRLIQALNDEKDPAVRWRIALSLGRLGGTQARDVLIQAVTDDIHKEVRESAAEGLCLINTEECKAPLIKALITDSDADVRGSAAYALGFMRCTQALPELIKILITDPDGEVRGRAAFALGHLQDHSAIPYLSLAFNLHKASIIRGNVTYALGLIGGVEAIPFLTQALAFDKDSYVRYRAAEMLGSIGDKVAIPPLKLALYDEGNYYGWKVKDMAFDALEKISRRLQVKIFKD